MADPFAQFADASAPDPFAMFSDAADGPKVSQLEAGARGLASGLTLNWFDELYGYGSSLPKLAQGKDAYVKAASEEVETQRKRSAAAKQAHPSTYLAADVGGGLVSGIGAMMIPGGQAAGAANIARAATLGSRVVQGSKIGAGFGTVAGAGAAETAPGASLEEVAKNTALEAGKGGLMGAAVGAVLPPAFDAAGAVLSPVANLVRARRNPQGVAADKVAEAFQRDAGGKAGTIFNKQGESPGLYRDAESIIADAGGENVQRKMRSALNVPNDQRTQFMKALDDRAGNQHAKIEREMVGALGNPKTYYEAADAIVMSKSVQAGPAYKAAFDAPFEYNVEKFTNLFSRPTMDAIKDRVERRMLDSGAPGEPGTGAVFNNMRPMEVLHHVKVELDHLIGQAAKAERRGEASSKEAFDLRTLMKLKEDFFDAMNSSGGEGPKLYNKAMSQYADHSALTRALETGYEHAATKEAPEVVRRALEKMSPPEQELYRLGVARKWAEVNRTGKKFNDRVGRDWSSPDREMMLDVVAKGPAERRQFQQALDAMAEQTKTRQKAQGNSTTAAQALEAQDDAKPADMLRLGKRAVLGQWSSLMEGLAQKAAPLGGMTPEVASNMLKILSAPLTPKASTAAVPYSWRATNVASGLPALQTALDRRAAREMGILRATGAGTGAGVGILTDR